ncbi:HdeD family acid-resistance protein [Halorussus halophilus]|uniref:HdeD family acid-resistance protein n=1 Tax=Halorussus halophilus TaxID=2650975 RepID=UPI001300DCB8|nr:HdeD family acid-resistance protein [Halorussus halophilus]
MSSTTVGIDTQRTESARAATAAGVVIAVLGLLAIVFPFVTGISLSILLGAVLVIGALVHVANAFSAGTLGNVLWQVVLAVLYGFAGITFIANPTVGLTTLTILAIAFFLVDGAVELVWGFQSRGQPGWTWLLVSGAISLLLAGLIWVGFPSSALWAIGVLFGVNLLVTGVSMVMVGRGSRTTSDREMPTEKQGQQM